MAIEKRGVRNLKTMAGMQDARRARSSSGALLEMSMLETERQRLKLEMQRAEHRGAEIRRRMDEIDATAQRLQKFVETRTGADALPVTPGALAPAAALTIHSQAPDNMKRRALRY